MKFLVYISTQQQNLYAVEGELKSEGITPHLVEVKDRHGSTVGHRILVPDDDISKATALLIERFPEFLPSEIEIGFAAGIQSMLPLIYLSAAILVLALILFFLGII
jgi:hypothetical protein